MKKKLSLLIVGFSGMFQKVVDTFMSNALIK